jgi:hypothetical protein
MHKKSAKRKSPVKNPRKLKEKSRFKTRVGYLIQSGYMKSCLAAQKRLLLFAGLGSFKQFLKIGLHPPLPGHFSVPLILKNTHKRLSKPAATIKSPNYLVVIQRF